MESLILRFIHVQSFSMAMLTLFRSLTGEDWNGIMHSFINMGAGASAVVYFLSFTLLSNFILLNLVVAVILENFADFMDPGDAMETGKDSDSDLMTKFRDGWQVHPLSQPTLLLNFLLQRPVSLIVSILIQLCAALSLYTQAGS